MIIRKGVGMEYRREVGGGERERGRYVEVD